MTATKVTISRKWNNPKITTKVSNEEISLEMDIEDFKTALKQEIGSVTWVIKKDTFDARLDDAVNKILSGVKEESAKTI
jgi:hypothetical protein